MTTKIKNLNPAHNIYIIKVYDALGKSLIKLGYSADIKSRINSYVAHNPLTEIIATYYVENGFEYEQKIHLTYKAAFKKEWYPIDLLETLIEELESVKSEPINRVLKEKKPERNAELSYKGVLAKYKIGECSTKQKASNHYKLINEYYQTFKTYTENSGYAKTRLKDLKNGKANKACKLKIQKAFAVGNRYSVRECKTTLIELYAKHNILRSAKATDMSEWFTEVRFLKSKNDRMIEIIKK